MDPEQQQQQTSQPPRHGRQVLINLAIVFATTAVGVTVSLLYGEFTWRIVIYLTLSICAIFADSTVALIWSISHFFTGVLMFIIFMSMGFTDSLTFGFLFGGLAIGTLYWIIYKNKLRQVAGRRTIFSAGRLAIEQHEANNHAQKDEEEGLEDADTKQQEIEIRVLALCSGSTDVGLDS